MPVLRGPALGADMQGQRGRGLFGGGPERFVAGVVVADLRADRDHRPCQSQQPGAFHLPNALLDAVHVEDGDTPEPFGVVAAEFRDVVVVGADACREQIGVFDLVELHARRGIEDGAGHAVQVHVFDVGVRVQGAGADGFELAIEGELLRPGEPKARLVARTSDALKLDAVGVPLVVAGDPNDSRGAVPEAHVDAPRPKVGGLEDVRVRRHEGAAFDQRGSDVQSRGLGVHGQVPRGSLGLPRLSPSTITRP